MRALDKFVAEKLRELANEIHATRRHERDQKGLEAIQRDNQRLGSNGKTSFFRMARSEKAASKAMALEEKTRTRRRLERTATLLLPSTSSTGTIRSKLAKASSFVDWFLKPSVRDKEYLPCRSADLLWTSDDPRVVDFLNPKEGRFVAKAKGQCSIRVKVKGTSLESDPVTH